MNVAAPTNPFHIARAYGVQGPAPTRPTEAITPSAAPAPVEASRPTDAVAQTKVPGKAERLIAGTVPGSIDFRGDQPAPAETALSFYRHPADRNVAATGVTAGRVLDVSG